MCDSTETLNHGAYAASCELSLRPDEYRVHASESGDTTVILCGGDAPGGLEAGRVLALVCLANRASVTFAPPAGDLPCPVVQVTTDDPVRACLASQYAGWQVKTDDYFAMASGPMRAMSGREAIFDHIPGRETGPHAVGVLEAKKPPTESAVASIRAKLPDGASLTLLVAPAASIAGSVQVVARSVETALHKLHELGFDVNHVVSGYGAAPLPPVAATEIAAIGRTNDAILYGGRVTLWVRCDDAVIDEIGPKVPSGASPDHGAPFAELFARYGDFYKIDPLLFSPAEVTFVNLATGRARTFGKVEPDLLRRSFFGG